MIVYVGITGELVLGTTACDVLREVHDVRSCMSTTPETAAALRTSLLARFDACGITAHPVNLERVR